MTLLGVVWDGPGLKGEIGLGVLLGCCFGQRRVWFEDLLAGRFGGKGKERREGALELLRPMLLGLWFRGTFISSRWHCAGSSARWR